LLNSGVTISRATLEAADETYRILGGKILGLIPDDISGAAGESSASIEEGLIRILIELRTTARKNKDFATSDTIRDHLAEIGVILEDRPDGTAWKINPN
jgi:cysteinyl-tRNA synthetase